MADGGFTWAGALTWAWNNRREILGYLKRVREWFRSGAGRGILIIGPGGVGKTTLAALLSGKFDWLLSEPWRYDESFGVEEYALKDDSKTAIAVPPGQTARRETMWAEVERSLAAGGYRGVIVVNANGYHTLPPQSYKAHALYKGNKEAFLAAYLKACRDDEVAVLSRVAAAAGSGPGKMWFLSVVAKEDLWWSNRDDAAAFYLSGDYAAAIAALSAAKGQEHFRHEIVPVSLVISNFLTSENELLRRNTEGYDHRQQVGSVRRLFEVLNALREWEAAR